MASIIGKHSFSDAEAEDTAKSFHKAMKGVGTDEKRIIREIVSHTNQQRQQIKAKYQTLYGKSLEEDLKSELSGHFEQIVVALLKPRYQYEAECLRDAIHGLGTKEHVVIEILCTKEGDELKQLKDAYKNLYGKDLEHDVKGETGGPLARVFRSLAAGNRPTGNAVDAALAKTEAKELYDAGEGKFGTDECELVRILVSRSFAQLRATFDDYTKMFNKDIEKAVKSETSGEFEDALVAIVESVRNRPAFFAHRVHHAVKGAGTKDDDLVRIIVTRSEVDITQIAHEYKQLYNHSLHSVVKSELSGHVEDIMVDLVGKE